jgi:hypothetical protein
MKQQGWTKLDGREDHRFRLQRAALIEYARATLPTRLSRRAWRDGCRDPSAMPVEIWQCEDDVALVWHVRHEGAAPGSAPRRVVGFLRQSAGSAVQQVDAPAGLPLPPRLADAEPVLYTVQFWQSDRLPEPPGLLQAQPAGGAEAPAPATAQPPQAEPAQGVAEEARIRQAQTAVDHAFRQYMARESSLALLDFELVPTLTPEATTTWRPQDGPTQRQQVAALLERANVCNFHLEADALERMVLLEREVPFYKGCRLYRVIDMRGPRSRFASFVLHHESADLLALHTQSTPIHEFNARQHGRGELLIDESTVAAYVRFFCEFVHGDAGAFSIIESPQEIRWLSQAEKNSAKQRGQVLRRVFTGALAPVQLYRPRFGPPREQAPADEETAAPPPAAEPPRSLCCRVFLGYARHLFTAGIAVHPGGSIEMFTDSALHDDTLPIQPLSFNIEFQFRLRVDAAPDAPPRKA